MFQATNGLVQFLGSHWKALTHLNELNVRKTMGKILLKILLCLKHGYLMIFAGHNLDKVEMVEMPGQVKTQSR